VQLKQLDDSNEPVVATKVPAAHAEQLENPELIWKVPTEQFVQLEAAKSA